MQKSPSQAPTPARPAPPATDLVFYDGTCGLCHRWVRFLVTRDGAGRFRFAAIGGAAWRAAWPAGLPPDLPDSIVVRTADGRTLERSDAIRHLGDGLGGGYRTAAGMLGLLPRWLLDWGYDLMARSRRRCFARPATACPIVPPELRGRFVDEHLPN